MDNSKVFKGGKSLESMNKAITTLFLSMVLVLSIVSAVSASTTLIAGKIYNADYSDTIEGATVTVNCDSDEKTATSLSDGTYSVSYHGDSCKEGSQLTVSAVKGDLYGSRTGEIHDDYPAPQWNLAVVNVPLVPEFGIVVGLVTILGAVGIFFFVRRK